MDDIPGLCFGIVPEYGEDMIHALVDIGGLDLISPVHAPKARAIYGLVATLV